MKNTLELTDEELCALNWILETLTPNEIIRNTVCRGCPPDDARRYADMLDRLAALTRTENKLDE